MFALIDMDCDTPAMKRDWGVYTEVCQERGLDCSGNEATPADDAFRGQLDEDFPRTACLLLQPVTVC